MLPTTQRLEYFTDAVIAIAITLLVFQLKPIELPADFSGALQALEAIRSDFFIFISSFAVLAIYWVNHHQFFTRLSRSSNRLLWTNLFFTFWMCLTPFPTELIGASPKSPAAIMIYGATLFMVALSFFVMHWLVRDSLRKEFKKYRKVLLQRAAVGPILYAIAIAATPFAMYISYMLFIAVPLFYFLPWRVYQKAVLEV